MPKVKPLFSEREQAANRKLAPRDLILKVLVPFILRDAGNGFVMEDWILDTSDLQEAFVADSVQHVPPACNTTACIGGTLQLTTGLPKFYDIDSFYLTPSRREGNNKIAAALGLSVQNTSVLFFGWEKRWPEPYRTRFERASTPLQKARAAASLLRQIAKRGDKVFKP